MSERTNVSIRDIALIDECPADGQTDVDMDNKSWGELESLDQCAKCIFVALLPVTEKNSSKLRRTIAYHFLLVFRPPPHVVK